MEKDQDQFLQGEYCYFCLYSIFVTFEEYRCPIAVHLFHTASHVGTMLQAEEIITASFLWLVIIVHLGTWSLLSWSFFFPELTFRYCEEEVLSFHRLCKLSVYEYGNVGGRFCHQTQVASLQIDQTTERKSGEIMNDRRPK